MKTIIFSLISLLIVGCVPPAVIKPVEDKDVQNLANGENAKPIQFSKSLLN